MLYTCKILCYLQTLIALTEKGFEKIGRMKNKLFIFNFAEDILFFSLLYGNELFFSKKSQPPLNIKWSVPNDIETFC